ncbi:GDP-mannose 4,6-dehydratase [Lentisphaerota bacterium WC36G]|nr:GDP-mannose 4,6-dehydratase [Lentisphaerae bacterium WC36]
MKILITGGAGFIGSHLTDELLSLGHCVTVIDNLSTGSEDNIAQHLTNEKFAFIKEDIIDEDSKIESLIANADMVYHLAAAVGVELVVNDPVHTLLTNVSGTEKVLQAAAKNNTRIIVASTSEVYGKSTKETFSETDDLLIGSPYNSRWSYACSKLLDEFFVMAFHQANDLDGCVVRFFNTVGPRQTGRYGMVLPRFVKAALSNENLLVYGTGEQTRCFCHVADTVQALRTLLERDDTAGKIYNIGNTEKISINQLAQKVIAQANSSSSIEKIPYEKAYNKGFEDMLHRAPNISTITNDTNWKPVRNLEKIINDVIDFINK